MNEEKARIDAEGIHTGSISTSRKKVLQEQVLQTIDVLCIWIQDRCNKNKPTTGAEYGMLPEVISATARLIESIK